MGIFSKKRKTSVETSTSEKTLQKIVKLSYIQSLAINGSLIDPRSLVETKGSSETITLDSSSKENLASRGARKLGRITIGAPGSDPLFGGVTRLAGSLFGKKSKTDTKITTEDSGWSLVKTWLQPEFDVIRYAIGIKELLVAQFTYVEASEFISKSWAAPKEISKVTLLVDQFIPPQFPPGVYIEYYIKPDMKDSDWIRINPLGTPSQFTADGSIVPRIITFNVERSVSSRIEESYISTPEPVKAVRFRALIKRPGEQASYTPVLRSYRLHFNLRNGL